MLTVTDLHTYYGDSHVLQGIALHVEPGSVVGLLGRNGAGKTTTISSIMGLVPPRQGHIAFEGVELVGRTPNAIASLGIGLVPQGRRIFPHLTVRENVTLAARTGGAADPWTLARIHELFPVLELRAGVRAGRLSGGEQQMLAIARALMTNPRLLLMDEPSEGLAPLVVREIGEILGHPKEEGPSILLVEQNLPPPPSVADAILVMNKGTIVFEGTPETLLGAEDVKQRYLGV